MCGFGIHGIQAIRRNSPDFSEQFPRPFDSLFLEVIAKRPTAEHFEKSVVVRIFSDVVQVIVFPAGADALLRVGGANQLCHRRCRIDCPCENGFELIHSRIGKKERRVIQWDCRTRVDISMFLCFEEFEELSSDFIRCQVLNLNFSTHKSPKKNNALLFMMG